MQHFLRFYILILFFAGLIFAKRVEFDHKSASDIYDGKCSLPLKWYGFWIGIMDKSETPVMLKIGNSTVDTRECKHSWGNQYLFIDLMESGDTCWRYMFFMEQPHHNILQFKETGCLRHHGEPKSANTHLSGDSTLVTLFRADADPEACPIRGPFFFNYSSNSGLCSSYKSKADMCASSHRLRLNFEACPDLPNSHQWRDDLECFANWQEGRNLYFAAKIINHKEIDDIKQYRCFVYDRTSPSGVIGRSADASCRALESIKIWFSNVNLPGFFCKFPHWLGHSDHTKKKLLWRTLTTDDDDEPLTYDVHRHDWILRKDSLENVSTTLCITETNSVQEEFKEFVIYTTTACDSYFSCLRVFRRNDQIVQLFEGQHSANQFAACTEDNFFHSEFKTLLLKDSRPVTCPIRGKYAINACSPSVEGQSDAQVVVGCPDDSKIVVDYVNCEFNVGYDEGETFKGIYDCMGDWRAGDVNFLLVSDETRSDANRCFIYSKFDENHLTFYDFDRFRDCKVVNVGKNLLNSSKIESCGQIIRSEEIIKQPDEMVIGDETPSNSAISWNEIIFKNLKFFALLVTFLSILMNILIVQR